MLVFVPATIILWVLHSQPIIIFFFSACAIIPLAKYIGEATEELSVYAGPAVGGLLNATFGNATELIIGIFALHAGLIEVVKSSIAGSIIGNLLLVLGMSMVAGGIKHKVQKFNRTAVLASGSTLLLGVIALVIPAIFYNTSNDHSVGVVGNLSVIVSICMIVAYIANVWFSLVTHRELYTKQVGEQRPPEWSLSKSIIVLFIATGFVALMSELLVGAIEPMIVQFGWSQLFIGVIFIAIIGNAAEHTSAITMAVKNRMDLALQISIGSAGQIAMFAAPVLVLISFLFREHMSLVFNSFELITIVLSVFISNLIVQDGESNWLEGLQLIIAYAIMAAGFFFFV